MKTFEEYVDLADTAMEKARNSTTIPSARSHKEDAEAYMKLAELVKNVDSKTLT